MPSDKIKLWHLSGLIVIIYMYIMQQNLEAKMPWDKIEHGHFGGINCQVINIIYIYM